MHTRLHAGWRLLLLVTSVASLILLPAFDASASELEPRLGNTDGAGAQSLIEQEEWEGQTLYPRANYTWPFATGPFYGKVDASRSRAPGVLHTAVGSFELSSGQLNIPAELRTPDKLAIQPLQYFIVQVDLDAFQPGELEAFQHSITLAGGAFLENMPVEGFLVRLNQASLEIARNHEGVLNVEPYHAAFKLTPNIGQVALPDPFRAVSDVYTLEVMVHDGEDSAVLGAQLQQMGGTVLKVFSDSVRVDIHRNQLPAIAAIDSVYRIFEYTPSFTKAEETTNVMQTGEYCPGGGCGPIPYHTAGIRGGGVDGEVDAQILMVLDTGIQLDNGDLSHDRVTAGTAGSGHRKVLVNQATNAFGGSGDLLGCDASSSGAFTHGHTVSATALGWATDVDAGYGTPWEAEDTNQVKWKLDGVAPEALLVNYDGQAAPSGISCDDPSVSGINAGNTYDALVAGYGHGARVSNFSFGQVDNNVYGLNADRIDNFLNDPEHLSAMVFVSAGNESGDDDGDNIPDGETVSDPATCKNCVVVGGTMNASDLGTLDQFDEDDRYFSSSVGPVVGGRIAPILMAPGTDFGGMGIDSEYSCRGTDNDQTGEVKCLTMQGVSGTSFASPAAAGAALLIRDYFATGFYPSGAAEATDRVADISGALVKATMIASAEWVGKGNNRGGNLTRFYRFNNEQGYGRIQLDRVLPLQSWSDSVVGLIVADGGIDSGRNDTTLLGSITNGDTQTWTFDPCDTGQELTVGLAWVEDDVQDLVNNIDLELESPTGKIYYGNYYTDDNDRDGTVTGSEDCPDFDGTPNTKSQSPWSLPSCGNSVRDTANPTEGIHLSPDPDGDGEVDDGLSQIESGTWTLRVIGTSITGTQRYALAVAGGVCLTSSTRFNEASYLCNDYASVTVNELDEVGDPGSGLTPSVIGSRTTIKVYVDDVEYDSETGITFTQPDPNALQFISGDIATTDGTTGDPGNGVLDVTDGATLEVIYADTEASRTSTAPVDCSAEIGFGNLVFGQFGENVITFVDGGCEKNARGGFEFGFPDKYMDEGEIVDYGFAFFNNDTEDLRDAVVTLNCVIADADSPAECRPESDDCPDPQRLNNTDCSSILTILDNEKVLGNIPSGGAIGAHFMVAVNDPLTEKYKVDMILGVSSRKSSKPVAGLAISRHYINVDDVNFYYSTDHPNGATETIDINGNETLENPTTNIGDFGMDYRFETMTWSDLTATGTKNTAIGAPWHFDGDGNWGNYTSGIGAISDSDRILDLMAQWGEDKNFNNILDGTCTGDLVTSCQSDPDCATAGGTCDYTLNEDRDPADTQLDRAWSTGGGCGWMTQGAGSARGAWHTGTANTYLSSPTCMYVAGSGQCQQFDSINITTAAEKTWFELLMTPIVEKVNTGEDAEGDPLYVIEHMNWAWNVQIDLPDQFAALSYEFDTDTSDPDPIGLINDGQVFRIVRGGFGPVSIDGIDNLSLATPHTFGGDQGFPLFRDIWSTGHVLGNNHQSNQGCYFDFYPSIFGALEPRPLDNDIDDDSDGVTDEYVQLNGPMRNMDMTTWNGLDMRYTTLEDIYGSSGDTFQGAWGFISNEGDTSNVPSPGYGVAIDDVVMQWREYRRDLDTTECSGGECATLQLQSTNFFDGNALVTIKAIEKSPTCASEGCSSTTHDNDCDLDGTPDGTDDCDGDTVPDIVVEMYEFYNRINDTEIVFLNQTGAAGGNEYAGTIPISATYNVPGTLFIQRSGFDAPVVVADYWDNDDGSGPLPTPGQICNNDPDPNARGLVQVFTQVLFDSALMSLKSTRLTDNGDDDGFADTNETVQMYMTLRNSSGQDLTNVIVRAYTNDPNIACISKPMAAMGDYVEDGEREGDDYIQFQVDPSVARSGEFENLDAEITLTVSSDQFDGLITPIAATMDLDLNVSGGSETPGEFLEEFEVSSGFGSFAGNDIDLGHTSEATSDDYRCQYNDPDFPNANSYGEASCHLGPADVFAWHIHDDRAYGLTHSVHWGSHTGIPDEDSHHFGQIEALELDNAIHLAHNVLPELTFKHQAAFADWKITTTRAGFTAIRGVVGVKLWNTGGGGSPVGNWIKIEPYYNVYDTQVTDQFNDCLFDPIDDGNDEDSYFDPTDPNRRLGPSSTCYPEFGFSWSGDTDYRADGDPDNTGGATDGPGLIGNLGPGTWVESKFSLDQYRGRSIIFRFLVSSIELNDTATPEDAWEGLLPGEPADDGWYIDQVKVLNTLSTPAAMTVDTTDNSGLPDDCGTNCTLITPVLTGDPISAPGPGHATQLSAASSTANACINGTLYFQFWIDGNADNDLLDPEDTLIRDWTDNPLMWVAPLATTNYGVKVRCSSEETCLGEAYFNYVVACPSTGNAGVKFTQTITFSNKTTITWPTAEEVDVMEGDLMALRGSAGIYNGTELPPCNTNGVTTNTATVPNTPSAGNAYYYLVRPNTGGAYCNAGPLWAGDTDEYNRDDATNGIDICN